MTDITTWLEETLRIINAPGGGGGASPTAGAAGVAAGASAGAVQGAATGATTAAVTPLAREIRAAIAAGGVNIAMYMVGRSQQEEPDPETAENEEAARKLVKKIRNDKEFPRQAKKWADNHGAFGLAGSKIKKDHAMPLSKDPGKLVTELLAAMKKELGTTETIPVANVALFSHGGKRSMQIDSKGAGGGEGWASASSNVVKQFASAVKPALTAGAKIHLFACTAAKDRDPSKGRDDATRVDSFAEDVQELTGAEVWGHENAAHTTGNPRLVEVVDTDADSNAERYPIRDVLARKFLEHVDAALTEAQMGYLDQKRGISTWIRKSLQYKGSGDKKKDRKTRDRHQIFIEEISMMGYDELFDLLIASSAPTAAKFRTMFPEHDQIDELVDGATAVRAKFQKGVEKMKKAIEAAKKTKGYPKAT